MELLDYLKEKGFEELYKKPFKELFEGYLKANEPKTFEEASEIVMKFISENHHPHTMAQIDANTAVLWEGQYSRHNDDFLLD